MGKVAPEFGFVSSLSLPRGPLSFLVRKSGHPETIVLFSLLPPFLFTYVPYRFVSPTPFIIWWKLFSFGKTSIPLWGQWPIPDWFHSDLVSVFVVTDILQRSP